MTYSTHPHAGKCYQECTLRQFKTITLLCTGIFLSFSNAYWHESQASEQGFYQTKTPYQPQQKLSDYSAVPRGYQLVSTQLVTRHGARGMTSADDALLMYRLWALAKQSNGLTPLGRQFGSDVMKLLQANALLGYGQDGIIQPGFGHESQLGASELRGLAQRMQQRLPGFLTQLVRHKRQIVVVNAGADRILESQYYFLQGLIQDNAALKKLLVYPPAPASFPQSGTPITQPDGRNRFLLYFHKLTKKDDWVTDSASPYYATYQASQALQSYQKSDSDLKQLKDQLDRSPQTQAMAKRMLSKIFTPSFLRQLAQGQIAVQNTGEYHFQSFDGQYPTTVTGDGKSKIKSILDAANSSYALYSIAPNLQKELGFDLNRYFPEAATRYFAFYSDYEDFYDKGPGIKEKGAVTYQVAHILQDDFFAQVDRIAQGDTREGAKLRFTHAEEMIPFISQLGIEPAAQQQPLAKPYSYANNPWRGQIVAPMMSNIQWDVYQNAEKRLIVRMLLNEKEVRFKTDCAAAQLTPNSFFYDYQRLRQCYGYR